MTHNAFLRLIALMIMACFGAVSAFAQQNPGENFFARDRYVAVTDRAQPAYDPQPLRLGALEVTPELNTGLGFRSNLFFADGNDTQDGFTRLNPSLYAETTWSRHKIGLDTNVDFVDYFVNSNETVVNFSGRGFGRFDLGSYTSITLGVFGAIANEPRSAAGVVVNSTEPIDFSVAGVDLTAQYQRGRLRSSLGITADRTNYDDVGLVTGGILDQDFRDTDEVNVDGRVDWAIQRDWSIFGRASYIDRETDGPTLEAPLDRDSDGVILQAGTSFELPVLVRGEIAVGYQRFDFDSDAFGTVEGVAVDANVQWFVSQLTTLTATVGRDIVDPGLGVSAGAFQTRAGIRADYELRRNLLIRAQADYARVDFEAIDREDDRFDLGLGVVWKINRNIHLDTSYQYTNQSSEFQGFNDNQVVLALRLFL